MQKEQGNLWKKFVLVTFSGLEYIMESVGSWDFLVILKPKQTMLRR